LGSLMMTHLLTYARLLQISPIRLSVDIDNTAAIPLYEKFNFKTTTKTEKIVFMEWRL